MTSTAAAATTLVTTTSAKNQRFVRRTSLTKDERRVNFKQIDRDAIEVVTSREACRATTSMSKIYLRLVNAGAQYLEKEGVLRFTGCEKEGHWQTAWEQLLGLLEVASATANKALTWMHSQGVIGYDAHKNGVGIRIFLNRAQASIAPINSALPAVNFAPQKNLALPHTSFASRRTSSADVPFNYDNLDMLELDINPHAPKNGAGEKTSSIPTVKTLSQTSAINLGPVQPTTVESDCLQTAFSLDEIVRKLKIELEPCVKAATSNAIAREHVQTREWFENKALPKAVRVAQKESYQLLRSLGGKDLPTAPRSNSQVGKRDPSSAATKPPRPRTQAEIRDVAEMCMALFEVQGKAVEATLSEICSENGGWLLAEDKAKVKQAFTELLAEASEKNRWSDDVKIT